MKDDGENHSRAFAGIFMPANEGTTKLAIVLLAGIVVMALVAGTLALNRAADLSTVLGSQIGRAESDAGYARAKAEDAKDEANRAEREARLAEYYAVDLKEFLAEKGLHPPQEPWTRQPKPKK